MKMRFGIIGVGGYIAPRHLRAIYDVGGELICAYDIHDCVGVLDSYFPKAEFFTKKRDFTRFLRHLQRAHTPLHFLSICTPNHLHLSHITLALQHGISAICEKPLCLSTREFFTLQALESSAQASTNLTKPRIYGILQLRLHARIQELRKRIQATLAHNPSHIYHMRLCYISARGAWYFASWKGDRHKSGGILYNIGVHLFDMLAYLFGALESSTLVSHDVTRASGMARFKHAHITWLLSINEHDLYKADNAKSTSSRPTRAMRFIEEVRTQDARDNALNALKHTQEHICALESNEAPLYMDFSQGFDELHSKSYAQIMQGKGFMLQDLFQGIALCEAISKQATHLHTP